MMKITYLNYMADLYGYSIGSTIKALKLFQNLEKLGFTVFVHWLGVRQIEKSAQEPTAASGPSLWRDLLFTPKQLLRNVLQFFRERQIIKKDNPDVLVVRLDAFRISALWLARLYRLPLVVEADGACSYEWLTFNNGRHLWGRVLLWCEKIMLMGADGIFTQSRVAKDYFVQTHAIDPDRIAVITNGADLMQEIAGNKLDDLREDLGIDKNARVIGFIGSMQQWHGMRDVQNLVRDILSEFDDVVFLFVGSGGALEKELHENLGRAGSRVLFTGTVPNELVSAYIQLFTIAIAPYPRIDLFYFSPMKVFEYMAVGKPIVASDSGQISELLKNEESALLYEPGNILHMKEALFRLLNNDDLQEKIADNAQHLFIEWHTWPHKARELDVYLKHCLHLNMNDD